MVKNYDSGTWHKLVLFLFTLVLFTAPVYAAGSCTKFLDPIQASHATPFQRRACMIEMAIFYNDSYQRLASDDYALIINNPASGDAIRNALPSAGLNKARDDSGAIFGYSGAALATALSYFLAPGLWVFQNLSFDPDNLVVLIFAFLLSWWSWATAARLAYVIPGRIFGWYSPEEFLWLIKWSVRWRPFYRPILATRVWLENLWIFRKASAKFTSFPETAFHVWQPGYIPLGRLSLFGIPLFQLVGISANKGRHVCIVAQVGSGKTIYLVAMLALHDGSSFIIDPGAQMYNAIGRHLGAGSNGIVGKGHKVILLAPFSKEQSSSWNPFDEIEAAVARDGRDAAVDVAKTLAAALIKITETRNEWVYTEARFILTALILYVYLYEPPERRNLIRLRELLTVGLRGIADEKYNPQDVLIWEMKQKDDFDGIIAKGAAFMEGAQGSDGKNHPRSTAIDQTSWLDLPQMAAICKHSDFHCEDLKKGKVSLFVAASVTDIQTKLSGWVRCLTMMAMEAFGKVEERPKTPCLFVIDEAPSLRIETLPTFAATFRKLGGRLVTVTQNLERLQEAYSTSWGGFLGDSECTVWMANDHKESLEYLSSILGTATRKEKVKAGWFSNNNGHVQRVERPLMHTHQLRQFLDTNIIVTRSGRRPMRLKPLIYFRELPIFRYEADPFYGEKPLRAAFRSLCQWIAKNVPIYAARLGAFMQKKVEAYSDLYVEPFFESRGGTQGGATVGTAIALAVSIAAFGHVSETKEWLEFIGVIAVASVAAIAGLIAAAWVFRGVSKDAYATATALVAGNFDGEHPYHFAALKFFGAAIALCVGWVAWVQLILFIVRNIESTLLWLLLGGIGVLSLVISLPVMLIGAFLIVLCIPPLLYIAAVGLLYLALSFGHFLKGHFPKRRVS